MIGKYNIIEVSFRSIYLAEKYVLKYKRISNQSKYNLRPGIGQIHSDYIFKFFDGDVCTYHKDFLAEAIDVCIQFDTLLNNLFYSGKGEDIQNEQKKV